MSLQICEVVRQWRWASRIELKAAAAQMGVADGTLARFEKGENTTGETMSKILRWMLAEQEPRAQGELPTREPEE